MKKAVMSESSSSSISPVIVKENRKILFLKKLSISLFLLSFQMLCFSSPIRHFQSFSGTKQDQLNWQLDATVNNVQFYHSIIDCNGKKAVILKFINKNNYKVKVSWKEVFTTQQGPQIEGFSGQKTLVIDLGETKETECDNASKKNLVIKPEQVAPTYVAEISKFEYKSITVTKAS